MPPFAAATGSGPAPSPPSPAGPCARRPASPPAASQHAAADMSMTAAVPASPPASFNAILAWSLSKPILTRSSRPGRSPAILLRLQASAG
eukprot:CAMPEP_0179297252 /NCGR_PEP_ID=MMETSP0797-20121207/45368_1 /TAXON_ID=47934 /ORGANISM="Dinophysis acuminata, Strain DAEP01" /LENGTH=89 /DNA_ID=CAMNT_0021006575 /DNA_START=180 /DNA_END=445 /DNA_ORIENTATION=-